jgi:glycosyltransferase involved in cell wall biosynthesis
METSKAAVTVEQYRCRHSVSVLILSYNEEQSIQSCIDSVAWSDDIVILDSFSAGNTVCIIKDNQELRRYQRRFDDFSAQRNHGLHEIEFRNEWVLIVDADETCPSDLKEELLATTLEVDDEVSVFSLRRKTFFP